ncbi:uncharacterized protein I206_102288 [Kwoniella pini CBS 10737]|uniref:Uncharacterized protein n=1 Tax=Kwoniella pini CBS 10737 TaxID=1296096 RepID=A0A1B9HT35_9TREE|nr:uncharacterized protein I206_07658 [Kwoniella pini CBS 10737]OCF46424.1 hypothetical protein I206_07658 [Kwoniella pini CBS 10737]
MPELVEHLCQFEQCAKSILGYNAICEYCLEARCKRHNKLKYHKCKEVRKMFGSVLDLVKQYHPHFINELRILRPDQTCTLSIPDSVDQLIDQTEGSGFNFHFLITFEDGVKWMLRIRQNRGHRPPLAITNAVIQSEVATLNLLKGEGIPVPQAYLPLHLKSPGCSINTPVPPLDYFYYDFMRGVPNKITRGHLGPIELPDDQLRLFILQYAKVQIRLSNLKLPYRKIGCIYPSSDPEGTTTTGPIVARGSFMRPDPPYLLGPFPTNKERYLAHIDAALHYISRGALQNLGIDEYLWHMELRELVNASKVLGEEPEQLYIKHDDEKGDHLMVNQEGEVIGILDWEWAYVTTKAEAFSAPYIFNRTAPYVFDVSNAMTKEEEILMDTYRQLNRPDLAECVKNGRLYNRLLRIGQYDPAYPKSGFREVFGDNIPNDFNPPVADVDWRVYMIKRCSNDKKLQKIMKKFDVTLEQAEEQAKKWHEKNDRKEEEMQKS